MALGSAVALLAAEPRAWGILALGALILAKLLGWGIALGSLRGGAIFPAIMMTTLLDHGPEPPERGGVASGFVMPVGAFGASASGDRGGPGR